MSDMQQRMTEGLGGRGSNGRLVARLFAILETFTSERPRLTLSDLSRRTGLPVGTVHRLVTQLVSFGALDRSADGRYGIGIRLWEIGLVEPRGLEGPRGGAAATCPPPGAAPLHGVAVRAGRGGRRRHRRGPAPSGGPDPRPRPGRRTSARATPAGRVLLAFAADADDLGAPEQHLMDEIRRTGIAIDDGLRQNRLFCLAVPVRGSTGTVVAALSAEVAAAVHDPKQAARELRACAEAISHASSARRGEREEHEPSPVSRSAS